MERFREEHGAYNTDDSDDDFSLLAKHQADSKAPAASVHRSASMSDLADPESATSSASSHAAPAHRASAGAEIAGSSAPHVLHRAASVDGPLNASLAKDNKENFAVPQDPASGGKKTGLRQPSRKVLNAQNAK